MELNGKTYVVVCPNCGEGGLNSILHGKGCDGLPVNERGEVNATLIEDIYETE